MTRKEKINHLKDILSEINENDNAVCYLTSEDSELVESAIEALEQQPCEDKIIEWKKDFKEYVNSLSMLRDDYKGIMEYIDELPVTPIPKTGYWVLLDECSNSGYYCSECHKKLVKEGWSDTVKKIKYCPNCGCRMVEPQESEET